MNAPAENVQPLREGFVERPADPAAAKPAADLPKAVPPPQLEQPPAQIPDLEVWPISVKLFHGTITNEKGETLSEVTFRKPRAGDINRYGNPTRMDRNGDLMVDEVKMTYVMAALSGLLPPFIEQMDPRDWNSCAYRLRGFFLPDVRALAL